MRFRIAFLLKFYLIVSENALSSNFAQKLAADIPSFVKNRPKMFYNIGPTLRPNFTATRGTHKKKATLTMEKLKLTGPNLGQVFNTRCGRASMLISKY